MTKRIGIICFVSLLLIVVCVSCSAIDKELIGTWHADVTIMGEGKPEVEQNYIEIVFRNDGTGYGSAPLQPQTVFTYSIKDGTIILDYVDVKNDLQTTRIIPYSLEAGRLTLKNKHDLVLYKESSTF